MKTLLVILIQLLAANAFCQVNETWVQRFTSDSVRNEGVNDMFVDAVGNVYVTGYQRGVNLNGSDLEAVTVKYNSQGVQQWIQNYHSPGDNGAFGRAIHVDAAGNVYVTGENAIVSGGGNEMLVIKYSPTGTQLWSYRFHYTGFSAYTGGYDIVTDLSGNVYVCGEYATNVITYNNIFVAKFSPTGSLIGQTFHHFASEGARKIGLDGAGKIIVGGYLNDNDSLSFIVLKHEQNLDLVWSARWGKGVGNQNVIDMAIDINSNIIVAGTNNVAVNYQAVKFSPSGAFLWGNQYNSSLGWDVCRGVVTDNLGNIYITGETGASGLPFSYDMTTVKYDPNGNELWTRSYDNNGSDGYRAYDIAIDNAANVYVTGAKYSTADISTVKYNTNGSFQWGKDYNNGSADQPVSVGTDENGNTYICGTSLGNGTGYDIAVVKYAPTNSFSATYKNYNRNRQINDLQNTYDTISVEYSSLLNYTVVDVNLQIDTVNHPNVGDLEFCLFHNGIIDTAVYRVGGSGDNFRGTILNDSVANTIESGTAPFTGMYKPSRQLSQFNGSSVNGDWILRVYDRATGNTGTLNAWSLSFMVDVSSGIHQVGSEIPADYTLFQNYPNPFNPSTKIKFQIPLSSFTKLAVYDITGRKIADLVSGKLNAGVYEYTFDAHKLSSGVYFYRLESEGIVETKKMLLIK